jgi:hypothetical protein
MRFAQFYPELMPILLNFLRNPPSTDEAEAKLDRMLRGKVLECCGLIGKLTNPLSFSSLRSCRS